MVLLAKAAPLVSRAALMPSRAPSRAGPSRNVGKSARLADRFLRVDTVDAEDGGGTTSWVDRVVVARV